MVLPNPADVISAMRITISTGAGAPTHGAPKGSLYTNTVAASTTTRLYINTDGGTTWASFTASA